MASKKILALSSSRAGNSGYFEMALPSIKDFLGEKTKLEIAFIPFAFVGSYDTYYMRVQEALKSLHYNINLVLPENAKIILENCNCVMTGGGNTFKLLHHLYELEILEIIRNKVNNGTLYIGWSAGSNILSPSIGTTNDMPIVQPKSFRALGLFPFQINPHYLNERPEGFNGETRDQRIEEFLKMNPKISVIGLPEGGSLVLKDEKLWFKGNTFAALFNVQRDNSSLLKRDVYPGEDLSCLL